jgi:hypothetical protein
MPMISAITPIRRMKPTVRLIAAAMTIMSARQLAWRMSVIAREIASDLFAAIIPATKPWEKTQVIAREIATAEMASAIILKIILPV